MNCILLDYGTGNLQSVQNAIEHLGHQVNRTSNPDQLSTGDVVIFPGQGSFGPAIDQLSKLNLIDPLKNYIHKQQPFIGICLGFQLVFNASAESPSTEGLNCFEGGFKKFTDPQLSVPHMGWNKIQASKTNTILDQFNQERFYFVHSYYLPSTTYTTHATTQYGVPFVSAIANKNQLITQFHPEKSGEVGLALLDQFFKGLQ